MYGEEHIILDSVSFPSTTGFRAMYPWPFGEFDYMMDDALNIAMDYLIRTGQAVMFRKAQATAAHAIAVAWRLGVRSRSAPVQSGDPGCGTERKSAEERLDFPAVLQNDQVNFVCAYVNVSSPGGQLRVDLLLAQCKSEKSEHN